MHMLKRRSAGLILFPLVALLFADVLRANTRSDARVVSLSFVEGTVIMRSPGSSKWTRAILNMPILQGVSLATARHSVAEVQFENGSTVRLGELSRVDFTQMKSAPHKGYVNHLNLALGLATLNIVPKRHDEYVLTASGANLRPYGRAEFRTDLSHGRVRVEVFTGRVQAVSSSQSEQLRKNRVLACDCAISGVFQLTGSIQMDEWDKWVQARDRQVRLAVYSAPGPGMYDWENDLIPFGGMGLFPGIFTGDGF